MLFLLTYMDNIDRNKVYSVYKIYLCTIAKLHYCVICITSMLELQKFK